MYKAIFFDWDGTLMDSQARIVTSMQRAAQTIGLPVPTDEEVKSIIGISLRPAIVKLFATHDDSLLDAIVAEYSDQYVSKNSTPSPMFAGATDLLAALSERFHLGVATGKARRGLNRAMAETNTEHLFVATRCADEAESKPSPDMLEQLLRELDLQASDAIYVGDTTHDMAMAEAINMHRIAVTYGVEAKRKLAQYQPTVIVDSIAELQDWLL